MQLRLVRAQEEKKRSVEFVMTATAVLSEEERSLVHRYRLGGEVIARGTITVGFISKRQMPITVTTENLVQGWTQRFEDLGAMIKFEDQMRASCQQLLIYLDSARKFGGQEIVEIELPKDDGTKRPDLTDIS